MSEDKLRGHFRNVKETSEGFKADCPACDDDGGRFAFNETKRVGCCFHASCIWFYGKGGVSERRLQGFFSKHGIAYKIPDTINLAVKGDAALPAEYEPLDELPSYISDDLYLYLGNRGIPKKIVEAAQIGYCQSGKLWGYLIFPVVDEERVVQYWQARRYKKREPKFRNPTGVDKSNLVYQIGTAMKPRRIILVESIINNLTIVSLTTRKDLPLSIFGKTMSEVQRDYVLQYQKWLSEVIIALDGPQEKDNTRHAAVQIAKAFEGAVPAVKIAKIPEAEDINSLGREDSWKVIDKAQTFHRNRNEQEFLHGEWR